MTYTVSSGTLNSTIPYRLMMKVNLSACCLGKQEMKELAALAYRDTSPESRDFWKNEMAQAIREIEQMYADKLDTMKTEMESQYNLKVGFIEIDLTLSVYYYYSFFIIPLLRQNGSTVIHIKYIQKYINAIHKIWNKPIQ